MTVQLVSVTPTSQPETVDDPLERLFEQWLRMWTAPLTAMVPFQLPDPVQLFDRLDHVDELL